MTSAVFCLFRVLRLFLPSTTACRPFHFPFPCSPTTKGLSWRVNAHSRACSSSTQHSGLAVFTELPKITWIRRSNSCLVSSSWICSFLWKCQWVINFKTLFWNQCVNQSVCQSMLSCYSICFHWNETQWYNSHTGSNSNQQIFWTSGLGELSSSWAWLSFDASLPCSLHFTARSRRQARVLAGPQLHPQHAPCPADLTLPPGKVS